MQTTFRYRKTLEAAAYLLQLAGGRMSKFRLVKLLYLTDRAMLADSASTLTGDQPVAAEKGPVLRTVRALLCGQGEKAEAWGLHIATEGADVRLEQAPPHELLSEYDEELLKASWEAHKDQSDDDISEETHAFKEWVDAWKGEEADLDWEDALRAQGRADLVEAAIDLESIDTEWAKAFKEE
jgi:uncharacterized phage-associated protein